jgi:RNA polymerase sigma factor (sigma-70 family)
MAQVRGAILVRRIRQLAVRNGTPLTDLHLLQQFVAERDESAFAALVQRHAAMVLGVCRNVLHHQQDAEDVCQAAFLVLARKAHMIRKQQVVSSWLHGVAYRLALKARARTKRRLERETLTANSGAAAATPAASDDLTVRELMSILHEELHRLPEKYRAPLLLCYW